MIPASFSSGVAALGSIATIFSSKSLRFLTVSTSDSRYVLLMAMRQGPGVHKADQPAADLAIHDVGHLELREQVSYLEILYTVLHNDRVELWNKRPQRVNHECLQRLFLVRVAHFADPGRVAGGLEAILMAGELELVCTWVRLRYISAT